jgi:hypothetical protein
MVLIKRHYFEKLPFGAAFCFLRIATESPREMVFAKAFWVEGMAAKTLNGNPYREFESFSLRQLGSGRLFSAQLCWQLSPVLAAISDLSSRLLNRQSQLILLQMAHFSPEFWTPRIRYGSPNSSVSRGLGTLTKLGFCSSSRTGESNRVRNRHTEVRYIPPQPGIPPFGQASQETQE